jgi:alpha-L-rhamnosidase
LIVFRSAQRDERRGWLADAALAATQALYNFDLIKFYCNYLNRIADDQRSDGELSEFSPSSDNGSFPTTTSKYPAEANWGSALPTITWLIYLHYKDVQTLQDYYKNNVAYVDYLFGVYKQHGLIDFPCTFGDWVPPPPQNQTNLHLITSFAFLHDVCLLINMSQVLGRKNDTDIYSKLYQQLAEEFHRVFFNTSFNFYADGKQSAQVLALALPSVVPVSVREAVVNQLVADINQKGIHVTTGIVSTARLYPVLSDNGHHDLALQLISSTTYPSYGYMFNNPYENATTLWERWDTATEGPGMNSRNQAMYGSIGAWFYSHLAGIDLSSNIITIRPRMASEAKKHLMSKLHCQLSTLYGIVEVSYTRDERDTVPNSILLHVTIPPNTRSRVMFEPLFIGAKCKTLMEGDSIIWSSDNSGISMEEFEIEKDSQTGVMIVHAGSGEYEFQAVWN